ncbi:MAG: hypothetical protein GY816_12410 [Cytophagales bacterium]|nr:hypothetical protein [Cytophagales bacterium]
MKAAKTELKMEKEQDYRIKFQEITSQISPKLKRCMEICREKGSSAWLTALPIKSLGYSLNKIEFHNSVHVRYNWSIPGIPSICACGEKNSTDHALTCKKGGYPILRHNAICQTESLIMKEAGCTDIKLEPHLLPVQSELYQRRTNIQDDARLDISARGIFGTHERTFFDVRVTHPNCPSGVFKPLKEIYKSHEQQKRAEYEERVLQSEKGSFVPLVFTTLGGMAPACNELNKKLAERIAEKRKERYSYVINHIRTRLRFSLLRGILVSLTGERGKPNSNAGDNNLYNVSFNLIPSARTYEVP